MKRSIMSFGLMMCLSVTGTGFAQELPQTGGLTRFSAAGSQDYASLSKAPVFSPCGDLITAGIGAVTLPPVRLTEPAEIIPPLTEYCDAVVAAQGDKAMQCLDTAMNAVVAESQTVETDLSIVALAVMGGVEECIK